jgi:protein O-GlcNAc transferase
MQLTPYIRLNDLEAQINDGFDMGRCGEYLKAISDAVSQLTFDERFTGVAIYYPELDKILDKIGRELTKDNKTGGGSKRPIFLASELYEDGGHTRLLETLLTTEEDPIVILTDVNGSYAKGKQFTDLRNFFADVPVFELPNEETSRKVVRLNNIVQRLASRVYVFTHHHDAVAIAALNSACTVPVYYVHHSDHRPSLGASAPNFIHIDMARHMAELCQTCVGNNVIFWPQGISDIGRKTFSYPLVDMNTASSGNIIKFTFDGPVAYHEVVSGILENISGRHTHIGYLPDDKVQLIRDSISRKNLSPERFVYVPGVLSLWDFLKNSDINVFIGSAPLGGLRTAIEVQGVGIPILPYRQTHEKPFLCESGHYPTGLSSWATISELIECLSLVRMDHINLSNLAREYYISEFSHMAMIKAMRYSHSKELSA